MMGQAIFPLGAAPSTPATGNVALYAKSTKLLYAKDDGGNETVLNTPATVLGASPDTGSVNAYAAAPDSAPGAVSAGMQIVLTNISATNTGASTFNLNSLGALPIHKAGGAALVGGELVAGADVGFTLNHAATDWILTFSSSTVLGGLLNVQSFTASGTYTPTAGATKARFRGVASGGAGGGTAATSAGQAAAGGGGCAGNAFDFWVLGGLASTPITIGTAGAGSSGAAGGNGGDLVIGTSGAIATIKGGVGGALGAVVSAFPGFGGNGGAPATSTVGGSVSAAVLGSGQAGGQGVLLSATVYSPGAGAPSGYGSGGVAGLPAGTGYGSGGQGAGAGASTAAQAGSAGAPGILVIEEHA